MSKLSIIPMHPLKNRHNSPATEFQKGQFAGNKHPGWKGGNNACIVCGIKLKNRKAKKCHLCYFAFMKIHPINLGKRLPEDTKRKIGIARSKFIGEKSSNWKGGMPFCLDCGKKITRGHLRCYQCSRQIFAQKVSRENHPNWRGGISKQPYPFDFNEELKTLIRKRDNYKCRMCGVPQEECFDTLHIHHIDYSKENLNPDNLITLCHSCHSKTVHSNREFWKEKLWQSSK